MIYLDHAATSFPKAPGVSRAVAEFLDSSAGNPGRGGHRLTLAASRVIEGARQDVAALLGGDPERLLFGPGATFWLNAVLRARLRAGDRVVVSSLEHNAVMRPLTALAEERGLQVEVVQGSGPSGVPTPEEVAIAVHHLPTTLVVLTHVSNVSGAVLPVEAIARTVAPTPVVVDGAQSAGSLAFDFADSGLAAYVASGHKGLLGPTGTGVLLLAPGFEIPPLVLGGTGSRSESLEMPLELPDRLEAGTPNGAGIAGLGAAARWLADHGVDAVEKYGAELSRRMADGLAAIPGCRLVGAERRGRRSGTVSFAVDRGDSGELAAWLDREHGIAVRAGLHCAPAAHRRLGTFPDGTIRVSAGPFSRSDEVDALLGAVETWRRRPSVLCTPDPAATPHGGRPHAHTS